MAAIEISSRARTAIVVAAVLVAGVLLGAVLRGMGSSPEAVTTPRPTPASEQASRPDGEGSVTGAGPSSSLAGVGVGFERSEQGAAGAAMSYATAAQSWLYLADEDLQQVAEAVVVPRSRDRLVGPFVDEVGLLRDTLAEASDTVWFVVAPLAVSVESYSDQGRAVVRVWTVRVLSADPVAVPQSGWQTVTLTLEWGDERGDWLIADVSEIDGPIPQLEAGLQPWSASYFDETLAGFWRVGVL